MQRSINSQGLSTYEFKDFYGDICRIQEINSIDGMVLWLSLDENLFVIDKKLAKDIAVLLQKFVDTGRITEQNYGDLQHDD